MATHGAMGAPDYKWKNVRVGAGGFAPNIVYSLSAPNLAYLRTDMGGLYRWEQNANRWIPLQDSMPESSYFGVESVAADPQDASIVYAAVGMNYRDPAAILRSNNKGDSWERIPVSFKMGGNEDGRGLGERLAIDPNNTSKLYFGSRHDGLMHSTDSGKTWHRVESFPYKGLGAPANRQTHAGISFVVFDASKATPTGSSHIYVGIADPYEAHIYASIDGGLTWQALPNQPSAELLPVKAALDSAGNLFITYCTSIGPNGITGGAVYRWNSISNKATWTNITPQGPQPTTAGGFMGLSLDNQHLGTLVVSTVNRWQPYDTIWRSTDFGQTWTDIYPLSTQDVSATPFLLWGDAKADFGWWISGLAVDPFNSNRVTYTTGATVYTATLKFNTDKTLMPITWKPWDEGIEQTAIITLNSLPQGADVISGFGDISGFYHNDLSQSPTIMLTNPVFANTNNIDFGGANPSIVVRSGTPPHRSHGIAPTLAWSQDGGKNWQPLPSPSNNKFIQLTPEEKENIHKGNTAITTSANGESFVVMTATPIISHDRGEHWERIKGLPTGARPVADRVKAKLFYALDFKTSELYQSVDQGRSFQVLNTNGLPSNISNDEPVWREQSWPLLATPNQPGNLWLVSSQGLFFSQNAGQDFHKIKTTLRILQLSFGKAAPNNTYPTLFAIAENNNTRGIYRSTDKGVTWIQVNDSQHQYGQRFRTLSGDPKHFGRVYVGTDGRGIIYGEPSN